MTTTRYKRSVTGGFSSREAWGVVLHSDNRNQPMLLGRGWAGSERELYPLEPTRPLLFITRHLARTWCKVQHDKYRGRTDCCADWRFSPVLVRERFEVVRRTP